MVPALEDLEDDDTNTPTLAFTDYITSYWVESNRHIWNHYQTDGPRTTNHLEGWHSKLKKHLQHPHPSIFNLIKLLKHEEAINDMKMIQYAAGGKRVPKKRNYRSDWRHSERQSANSQYDVKGQFNLLVIKQHNVCLYFYIY